MAAVDVISGDRRKESRYAVELPLRFIAEGRGAEYQGSGHTKDLSRKTICFYCDSPPPNGADVELRIEWPFLLQDVCPLELRVWGQVIRGDPDSAVIRMVRYEFRTRGATSFDQPATAEVNWSIVA
jgi:hypothetical protein